MLGLFCQNWSECKNMTLVLGKTCFFGMSMIRNIRNVLRIVGTLVISASDGNWIYVLHKKMSQVFGSTQPQTPFFHPDKFAHYSSVSQIQLCSDLKNSPKLSSRTWFLHTIKTKKWERENFFKHFKCKWKCVSLTSHCNLLRKFYLLCTCIHVGVW